MMQNIKKIYDSYIQSEEGVKERERKRIPHNKTPKKKS